MITAREEIERCEYVPVRSVASWLALAAAPIFAIMGA